MTEQLCCPKSPDGRFFWTYIGVDVETIQKEVAADHGPDNVFFKWEAMAQDGWSVVPVQIVEQPTNRTISEE